MPYQSPKSNQTELLLRCTTKKLLGRWRRSQQMDLHDGNEEGGLCAARGETPTHG
uniref:Uncharacterized protein n=1 Tax=Arundo donax TaxID=35708 RepID=A0A0A9ES63_ARUDO